MIKVIGFSGTKAGMTINQAITVLQILKVWEPKIVHHGGCIGSDEQMHVLAKIAEAERHVHPPTEIKYQAGCKGEHNAIPKPYLVRNQAIVDASEVLIATPQQALEIQRSGTWATIRRARNKGIPLYIIKPNGEQYDG